MSASSVSSDAPSHIVSSFDYRVTQRISVVMFSAGSSRNARQLHRRGTFVPFIDRQFPLLERRMRSRTDSTGNSSAAYCPCGKVVICDAAHRPMKPRD
jgi:hypothetical protein